MSNIEEDIELLKSLDTTGDKEFTQAIENILLERKQDKKRIKKLEEENKKKSIENICYQEELENSIPVQKVKDKINEYIEQKLVELTKTGSYTQNEGTPEQERLNGMQKGAKDIKTILLEDKQ